MWRMMVTCLFLSCCCNHPNVYFVESASSPKDKVIQCGGWLTDRVGVIQTPGFPRPFPVPIHCLWIIDASGFNVPPQSNLSIVIYLTQVFSTTGLTFTKIAYYDKDEHKPYGEVMMHKVTEQNVTKFNLLVANERTVAVEFKLDRLEGNHLRVLDELLEVYGFNITYEISEKVKSKVCSVVECSFLGNCYASADYTYYECSCFKGYSGHDCGRGPLCKPERHTCLNGATCRHVGSLDFKCNCTPGYAGKRCDVKLPDPEDLEECGEGGCVTQCPYDDGNPTNICNCGRGPRVQTDRVRYEGTVRVANMTAVQEGAIGLSHIPRSIESVLQKQISKYLRSYNISKMDELQVLNVTPGGEVTFNFLGGKRDGSRVRDALNRLVERGRLGNVTLVPTNLAVRQEPTLLLQSVRVNQDRPIRENDEFILSCVAQGSSYMTFRWYKDGVFVNESKSIRNMWTRLLPMDSQDQYTALLGIERATRLDEGLYTCQVVDWGMQQCKALRVEIMVRPEVRVSPMSITLEKGNNVNIKCMSPNDQRHEKFGFNWTKNKALFRMIPGKEVWEDLHPSGSILKIYNAQKSSVYTCLVQGSLESQSISTRVEVVNSSVIPLCPRDHTLGVAWPRTAPAQYAIENCPNHYAGHARRLCSLKDTNVAKWHIPDFSFCVPSAVTTIHNKFRSLTLGYQGTTGTATLHAVLHHLTTLNSLLPGEGEVILEMLRDVQSYLNKTSWHDDILNCTQTFYHIMSLLLGTRHSVLNQERVIQLQELVKSQAVLWGNLLTTPGAAHAQFSSLVVYVASLDSTLPHRFVPSWVSDKIDIHIETTNREKYGNGSFSTAVIIYKNLSQFLPMRYVAKLKNGSELEYEINSRVVSIELGRDARWLYPPAGSFWVDLELDHFIKDYNSEEWNALCAVTSAATFEHSWNFEVCRTHTISLNMTRCRCSRAGTYAVLLTSRPQNIPISSPTNYHLVVLVGCACCLFQALLTLILLLPYWWHHRSCLIFLKLQCCTATTGAMGVFIYAVRDSVPKNSFPYVTTSLEAFLLIGMSSHLSKLLIVYTEVVQIPKVRHIKQTVVSIITGVPVLAVLCNHLAHHSTGWQLTSWWLICGTMLFNIFVASAAVMLLMFVFLYFTVMRKLHILSGKNTDGNRAIKRRVGLLKRAGMIFIVMVIMEASSILYINVPDPSCHYIFSFTSALLGFIIFLCYVLKSETPLRMQVLRKLKLDNTTEDDYSSDSANSPLRFFTKQDGDAESEGPPPRPSSSLGMDRRTSTTAGDDEEEMDAAEGLLMVETSSRSYHWTPPSDGPPSTIETYVHSMDGSIEECGSKVRRNNPTTTSAKGEEGGEDVDLESYHNSPKKYQKNICGITEDSRNSSDYVEKDVGDQSGGRLSEKWRFVRGYHPSDGSNSVTLPRPEPGLCYIRDSSTPPPNSSTTQEILTTRVCVELGVITPQQLGDHPEGEDTPPAIVLCSVDVEPCHHGLLELTEVTAAVTTHSGTVSGGGFTEKVCAPEEILPIEEPQKTEPAESLKTDLLSEKETAQGEVEKAEKVPVIPKIVTTDTEDDNMEGMLDRISHDLDYLLNRKPQTGNGSILSKTPSFGRKTSKPPANSVRNQIKEEDEEEEELILGDKKL
ncbi:uncharacterized protein [Anabrus simplex]|uniref:uncharacterized protein n=1 Tax=Anabrus simplex TaxID=316456 RepID=UPI0035A2DF1A